MARPTSPLARLACLPVLLVALVTAEPGPTRHIRSSNSSSITPFVINGDNAGKKQFPEMVSIQVNGNFHICGGAIIDKNWILTAAHCVEEVTPDQVTLLAGTRDHYARGTRVRASSFIIHEDYATVRGGALVHDIALIKTSKPIRLTNKIRLGKLHKSSALKEDDRVTVAGWGYTSNDDPSPSRMLQFADLAIESYEKCQEAFSKVTEITDDQLCTFESESDQGECKGDSGGPLFRRGLIVGVVSWSKKPCGTYPGVYASVPAHYDWIKKNSGISNL